MTQPRPKPKSKQPKYQVKKLETATNSQGEVFNAGDLIRVKDLKGNPTTAKIEYFYTEPRGIMAVYTAAEADGRGLCERKCWGFPSIFHSRGGGFTVKPHRGPHERPVQEEQEQGWEWEQGCSLIDTLSRV